MPPPLILRLEDRSTNLEAYLSLQWTTAPPSHHAAGLADGKGNV